MTMGGPSKMPRAAAKVMAEILIRGRIPISEAVTPWGRREVDHRDQWDTRYRYSSDEHSSR
jgi:hypothetical protein